MQKISLSNSSLYALVDDEDYPVLSRLTWYKSDTGYAISDSIVKHLKMHKLIIGPIQVKSVIDHIDKDKLNNQKCNLRVVSQSVNSTNSLRVENAKHYYYEIRRSRWVVDSRSLNVRGMYVDNPIIADRVVKRLKLGFPKNIAFSEAHDPKISITNWGRFGVDYLTYLEAKQNNTTVAKLKKLNRRKQCV